MSGTCSIAGGTITRTWIGTEALLFQTGYLTITAEQRLGGKALYRLGYPNREVRQSLNEHLLRHLMQDSDRQTASSIRLARLLEAHDCGGLKTLFHAFFASIPHQWYTNNHIADYEGFYASVFYGGGVEQPRAPGHGRTHRRPRLPVRVQGGRDGAARVGPRPVAGAPLRRQVPRHRRTHPPHWVFTQRSRATPRCATRSSYVAGRSAMPEAMAGVTRLLPFVRTEPCGFTWL